MLEKTYACPGGMFDFVFCIDRCHFDKAPVIKSLREWATPGIQVALRTSCSSVLTNRHLLLTAREGNVFRGIFQTFCSRDGGGKADPLSPGGRSHSEGRSPRRDMEQDSK